MTGLAIGDPPSPTNEYDYLNSRLPLLRSAVGPPLHVEGTIGGAMTHEIGDRRLEAVSMGFPISVHPLRIPNTRAQVSTASSHSVIDFRFVRLAGLLHEMTLLRPDVDDVKLSALLGNTSIEVLGWVDVTFDALGYEFKQSCWVIRLFFPVEIQLGTDWLSAYKIKSSGATGTGNININDADAKKVRKLQDTYVAV
ncbi:hypothetical protein QCA50_016615 [Cerrena zonata]|uniref:Uncharacterized protein n=1 Tax=Cerrena zonata TaxID=2478898 RepID=A0AAW0FMY4_9APHY